MTQQEKQINYMGPFITMVFLFFIVGSPYDCQYSVSGSSERNFSFGSGRVEKYFCYFDYFLLVPCLSGLWRGRLVVD